MTTTYRFRPGDILETNVNGKWRTSRVLKYKTDARFARAVMMGDRPIPSFRLVRDGQVINVGNAYAL